MHNGYGNFWNEFGALIGHDSADVTAWLAANPEYVGAIWFDNMDGGDHVEVTEIFFGEEA